MPHRHDSQFQEKDPVEIVVLQCWLGRVTWLVDMTPKYHKNITVALVVRFSYYNGKCRANFNVAIE